MEQKDICSDLAIDLLDFKREAARAAERAEELKREAEELVQQARRAANEALIGAALAAAGAFGTAAKTLRIFRSLRKLRDLTFRDWLGLAPVIGGAYIAGSNALDAIRDSLEARQLSREAQRESQKADSLGAELARIAWEYRQSGCDSSDRRRIS
ncbi:MAG: hypothetical protein ACE5FO_05435 [Parvularculaceae bacterium]